MRQVGKVLGVLLFIGAVFAFDYFADLPEALGMPELFDCVTQEEIASGVKDRGFQFCTP